jgi:2C-methyl-D-erythritol 2,4-cyclodiphosphate synthase
LQGLRDASEAVLQSNTSAAALLAAAGNTAVSKPTGLQHHPDAVVYSCVLDGLLQATLAVLYTGVHAPRYQQQQQLQRSSSSEALTAGIEQLDMRGLGLTNVDSVAIFASIAADVYR